MNRKHVVQMSTVLASLMMLLIVGACENQAPAEVDVPRIAVITAFAPELAALIPRMTIDSMQIINGRSFRLGKLGGKDVVLFMSGISVVNAAMTTQLALGRFNIARIVFSGIAGGVNPGLDIGDVTVPREWANYQEQTYARETAPGMYEVESFQTRDFGNYQYIFPQYTMIARRDAMPDTEEAKFWLPVDAAMLQKASQLVGQVTLQRCSAQNVCLSKQPVIKVGGRGVSGPTFVNYAPFRNWVWSNFQDGQGVGVDALDEETGPVAAVAYANRTPYIGFRSLSDLAGGGPGSNEISVFFEVAANNSASVVEQFLKSL